MNGPRETQDFEVKDSSWKYFPTEDDPFGKYKYYSFHPQLDKDLKKVNRKTKSLLDLLGDVGGFFRGTKILVELLVSSYNTYAL